MRKDAEGSTGSIERSKGKPKWQKGTDKNHRKASETGAHRGRNGRKGRETERQGRWEARGKEGEMQHESMRLEGREEQM